MGVGDPFEYSNGFYNVEVANLFVNSSGFLVWFLTNHYRVDATV